MKAKAIDVVIYPVKDLQRAVTFYRDTLGFPTDETGRSANWMEIDMGSVTLALTSERTYGTSGPTGGTIAVAVDDVHATTEELRQKRGSIINGPFDAGSCYMTLIQDIVWTFCGFGNSV